MTLGDNAYLQGREAEFQVNIFNGVYGAILRNTCLWPVPGNHYYYSGASAATQTGTYYSLFAPPTSGQCGGVPSGTESYYSFDIGNVHIVCLDSYGVSRSAAGALAPRLQQGLVQAEIPIDWSIADLPPPPWRFWCVLPSRREFFQAIRPNLPNLCGGLARPNGAVTAEL